MGWWLATIDWRLPFAANVAAADHDDCCSKISRAICRIGKEIPFAVAEIAANFAICQSDTDDTADCCDTKLHCECEECEEICEQNPILNCNNNINCIISPAANVNAAATAAKANLAQNCLLPLPKLPPNLSTDMTDTNDTDEGRQNNRRTEFKILSK